MKKLLLIFVFLVLVAVFATIAGILAGGKGGSAATAGDGNTGTVLVWRVEGPVLEQEAPRFPFSDGVDPGSIAELYPAFRAAVRDRGVKGLAVYLQSADFGLAKAQE